jgi:heavy metal efflux system protein
LQRKTLDARACYHCNSNLSEPGPAQIGREQGKRIITVQANARARPLASFVTDAQQAVASQVRPPPGYTISWGGSFQDLQEGMARLSSVVPVALAVIFLLLYLMFASAGLATLIFFNVPFAAVGGIFALALRGMPSVSRPRSASSRCLASPF